MEISILGKYADVRVDLAFKRCFGSEQHKAATIGLINAMIPGIDITDVKFEPTELQGLSTEDRKGIIDVLCTAQNGDKFIVEMQRSSHPHFRERTLYYSSLYLLNQAKPGDWNFELKTSYVIAFVDFPLAKWGVDTSKYDIPMAHYITREKETNEVFPGSTEFYFFDLPSFLKKEEEIANNCEKWLFLLRNSNSLTEKPKNIKGPEFDEFFTAAEIAGFSKDERIKYEKDMVTELDRKAELKYVREEGIAIGRAEGEARGRAEGRAEGKAEGIAEGEAKAIRQTAANFKKLGVSVTDIAKATGLSEDEVQKL